MKKLLPSLLVLLWCNAAYSQVGKLEQPAGIRFAVSAVTPAAVALPSMPVDKVYTFAIGKQPLYTPHNSSHKSLYSVRGNALIETVQECYDHHRPLVLSPDAIWLTICQGMSTHINLHFDSLQSTIFPKSKPSELVVRNDSLRYKSSEWAGLIAGFSDEIAKYTRNAYRQLFVPSFSTTTSDIRTAYQVTLMQSTQKEFSYVGESGCGIPYITLSGTREDWVDIQKRLESLQQLGLGYWAEELRPVIAECIGVYDGKRNKEFWESIYKSYISYNEFYISGWILKLFPYVKTWENEDGTGRQAIGPFVEEETLVSVIAIAEDPAQPTDNITELEVDTTYPEPTMEYYDRQVEVLVPNPYLRGNDYLLSMLSTDNFPSSIAKVDMRWIDHFEHTENDMELYAGFIAIRQYADKSLEPFISWAVCYKDTPALDKRSEAYIELDDELLYVKINHIDTTKVNHPAINSWCPFIFDNPDEPAIYNSKQFKTAEKSLQFVTEYLENGIRQSARYATAKLSKLKVSFSVLSNGKVGSVMLTSYYDSYGLEERSSGRLGKELASKNADKELTKLIDQLLQRLPEQWKPALNELQFDYWEDIPRTKVRANSLVTVTLFEE